MLHGLQICTIEVCPQGATNEQPTVDLLSLFFQDVHIVEMVVGQHIFELGIGLDKVTVIVFMIAHDKNHMWELRTTPLEEICNAIATSTFHKAMRVWAANVMRHADVP